jgi:hypothetical protein
MSYSVISAHPLVFIADAIEGEVRPRDRLEGRLGVPTFWPVVFCLAPKSSNGRAYSSHELT